MLYASLFLFIKCPKGIRDKRFPTLCALFWVGFFLSFFSTKNTLGFKMLLKLCKLKKPLAILSLEVQANNFPTITQ